ncbi:MAG: T9SS type A sorting domain-containing protein [Flavobacteriales bacterium]|nr:T9SS type A sorting domain-containing protein [Flavobacteriales bacterium]
MKKITSLISFFLFNIIISSAQSVISTPEYTAINKGESVNFNIELNDFQSFSQQIFFEIYYTSLPSGQYSYNFLPNYLQPPYIGNSILNIETLASIPEGSYDIVVQAYNGPINYLDTCHLIILPPNCDWENYEFSNSNAYNCSLTIDNNGNKWVKGSNFLLKFDGVNWTEYTPPSPLYGILRFDQQNNLWCCSNGFGLYKFDGIFWSNYNTTSSSLPTDSLRFLVIDNNNDKWVTSKIGLIKFDGVNSTLFNTNNSPLLSNKLNTIFLDNYNDIYITNNDYSDNVSRFVMKFDKINTWNTVIDSSNTCFDLSCLTSNFTFDSNNNLWFNVGIPQSCYIDSINYGLVKYDQNQYTWELWIDSNRTPFNHFIKDVSCNNIIQNNTSKLPVSYNNSIIIDSNNNIWLSHLNNYVGIGSGITKFDGINWKTYTKNNSNLIYNSLQSLALDGSNIWAIERYDFYGGFASNNLTTFTCNDISTNIDLQEKQDYYNIYPTITNDYINIIAKENYYKSEIQILHLDGRILYDGFFNGSEKISLSNLSSGFYIVVLKNSFNKNVFTKKIIKL